MQQEIFTAISQALGQLGIDGARFTVERPAEISHGDYATNAALIAAHSLGKNPREVAEELVKALSIGGVEKMEIAGPGFINFFLSRDAILSALTSAATEDSWGRNGLYEGKTVMVEYTQPNPFKEFHIGHLMSNALGESVARILEHSGAKVLRANYQGDIGPHVAKAMYVLLEKKEMHPTVQEISAAYVEGARLYEEDAQKKDAIDALNKSLYQQYEEVRDKTVWELYQHGRKVTLEHFELLYKMLGTKFDFYFFESETGVKGAALVRSHMDVFEESEGAIVFRGEEYGLHTRVFINRLGLPTYEAKDLGLAEMKKEKAPFDLSITTTAVEQTEYFKVVFKALELIYPKWAGQFTHVSHGMMRFASGKMSSRKGNVITGESLLFDLEAAAKEKIGDRNLMDVQKTAQEVAVGAVKYAVLKQGSGKDIIFDPEHSLSLEGDSGPYLQYACTRAKSLLRAAKEANIAASTKDAPSAANELERTLIHFPEIVSRAVKEFEPHYITTYLTEIASLFNSWYASERIIGGAAPEFGVLLTTALERTMAAGLLMLAIPSPAQM